MVNSARRSLLHLALSGVVLTMAGWDTHAAMVQERALPPSASAASAETQVRSTVSATAVWTRQQVLVTAEVRSPTRFFQLQAPAFNDPRLLVVPLQTSSRVEHDAGGEHTVKSTGWALIPLRQGELEIELPPVDYLRGGRLQQRLRLPPVTLSVRALPPYIPADMPVGRLRLATRVDAPALLTPDNLVFWNIEAQVSGQPAANLPPMLAPLRDSRWLRFLPAEPQRREQADPGGLRASLAYRVPFVVAHSGRSVLPALQMQYFDPDSGRIVRVRTEAQPVWALATVWRLLLAVCVLVACGYGGLRSARRLRERLARARRRRRLLQAIGSAACARDIRAALQAFGRDQGWPLDGSLGTWLAAFRRRYRGAEERLEAALARVNRLEYGRGAQRSEFGCARQALHDSLHETRPRRKRAMAVAPDRAAIR